MSKVGEKNALVFDMDGVLVDEGPSYRQCIKRTVEDFFGKKIDPSLIEDFKTRGGYNNDYDCVEGILRELGIEFGHEEMVKKFDQYYEVFKTQERWLLDERVLQNLSNKYRLGIFTGRPKRDAVDALKRFKKEAFFEVVITDEDVDKTKPDPEGLLLACTLLQAKKTIYVGDSIDDVEAAKRANIDFIGVVHPGGSKQVLQNLGVDVILDDINKIEEALSLKGF